MNCELIIHNSQFGYPSKEGTAEFGGALQLQK